MGDEELELLLIVVAVAVTTAAGVASIVAMVWLMGASYPPPVVLLG